MPVKKTKITLSDKELDLVTNTEWILTKKSIIEKVCTLFGELSITMQSIIEKKKKALPAKVIVLSPKITKGENYQHLPYVVLDYPRYFSGKNSFAIRTIFWWGNFFSVQLLVSGECKQQVAKKLVHNFLHLKENNYYVCIAENPWQHHFEPSNYTLIKKLNEKEFNDILNKKEFIKTGKKISLEQWDEVPFFIEQLFSELIMLIETSYPNDGKDL